MCACNGTSGQRAVDVARAAETAATLSASPASAHETQAAAAGAVVFHEVWRNGHATGRRYTSLIMAQTMADRLGGEVRPANV